MPTNLAASPSRVDGKLMDVIVTRPRDYKQFHSDSAV